MLILIILFICFTIPWSFIVAKISEKDQFHSELEELFKPIFVWTIGEIGVFFLLYLIYINN